MYHHVTEIAGHEHMVPYVVSPATFRRQLDAIVDSGMPVVTLAELIQMRDQQTHGRKRCIVLTFDDCSRALWDFALPELHKRSLRATFFAVSEYIGGENVWDDHRGGKRVPLMTAEQLRRLTGLGHEVGSHAATHRRLRELSSEEVEKELMESRQSMESILGVPVKTLSYPFGSIPKNHLGACAATGYSAACSIFSKANTISEDPYAIRRILAHENDVGWRIRMKLSLPYLVWRGFRDPSLLRAESLESTTSCPPYNPNSPNFHAKY